MEFVQSFILPSIEVAVIAYLIGSISFSIVFTKIFAQNKDIRTMGSGNAGMTNVLRSVGIKAAVFTFIFDFAKGILSVFIGKMVFSYFGASAAAEALGLSTAELIQYGIYIAGVFCVMGHIFPIYFGFKGGKGVLTSWAIIALIDWRAFLAVIIVFLVVLFISKIVSLASICAAGSFPIFTFLFNYFFDYLGIHPWIGRVSPYYPILTTLIAFALGFTVIIKHKANIQRIKNGTEKTISVKRHNT